VLWFVPEGSGVQNVFIHVRGVHGSILVLFFHCQHKVTLLAGARIKSCGHVLTGQNT
jgi:hypothetical protein